MQVTTNKILILFFGRIPSKKNGKVWVQRGRRKYLVPSTEYQSWERSEIARLKATVTQRNLTNFHVTIAFFFPDNGVHDLDNIETSIMDCLQMRVKGQPKNGIILDDSWQCMSSPTTKLQPVIDRLNPRVEVTITWETT